MKKNELYIESIKDNIVHINEQNVIDVLVIYYYNEEVSLFYSITKSIFNDLNKLSRFSLPFFIESLENNFSNTPLSNNALVYIANILNFFCFIKDFLTQEQFESFSNITFVSILDVLRGSINYYGISLPHNIIDNIAKLYAPNLLTTQQYLINKFMGLQSFNAWEYLNNIDSKDARVTISFNKLLSKYSIN